MQTHTHHISLAFLTRCFKTLSSNPLDPLLLMPLVLLAFLSSCSNSLRLVRSRVFSSERFLSCFLPAAAAMTIRPDALFLNSGIPRTGPSFFTNAGLLTLEPPPSRGPDDPLLRNFGGLIAGPSPPSLSYSLALPIGIHMLPDTSLTLHFRDDPYW